MPFRHNFPQFFDELRADIQQWNGIKEDTIKEIAIQALADLQTLSPVDTGLYRGSHDLTISSPSAFTRTDIDAGNKGRSEAEEQINKAIARLQAVEGENMNGLRIFITNNLQYATPIEFGSSMQAPEGVYALAQQRAEANFAKAIAQDRGKEL